VSTLADRPQLIDLESSEAFFNRELSWLGFARRVLALAEDRSLPLLERVKFAGITGMLHDEFSMKRISGLKRQMKKQSTKLSLDGRVPAEEFAACKAILREQASCLSALVEHDLRPALALEGLPILDVADLGPDDRRELRDHFETAILPILTPLAVDAEHPFPFISNLGLNVAVRVRNGHGTDRFVRVKVPDNRPRWVPLRSGGWVPLEQVIAANLDFLFPKKTPRRTYLFRVTRGAGVERADIDVSDDVEFHGPGGLVRLVTSELKARRFAGVVRVEVSADATADDTAWLTAQLGAAADDVDVTAPYLGVRDLLELRALEHERLHYPRQASVTHPRLAGHQAGDTGAIFHQISRGDILLHHPYDSFDTSVLRFLESAAVDPSVLAIKLTIYRTSSDSAIVKALAEAARRGKQVAVLVEITARFDEAPNIAWGKYLEEQGAHVAYGVEKLKTHVKAALVVREEKGVLRRYAHLGTGNYHTGTARVYEDIGVLTADPAICADVAAVFNQLTGATPTEGWTKLLVAPDTMRPTFVELIRREAAHAEAGRPARIDAKMNQLQDPELIRELYRAGRAGVPVNLIVRGLCCLRPGVPGLSETIRVTSVVGRFLEHSRLYRFENGGSPAYYIGSADWMKRNLSSRVETIMPVEDSDARRRLDAILRLYDEDNASAWDGLPDGSYVLRRPADGQERRAVQERLIAGAADVPKSA
jgi:polyphosphate kinase